MKQTFVLLIILWSTAVVAQEHVDEIHDEHHHDHHRNEIGIANSPVYFLKEKEFAYGLHLHYVRGFNHSRFGVGLGYERIFDEHQHQTIGAVVSYRPAERVVLIVSPGVTFEGEEKEKLFAVHFEATYEFTLGDIHLGPAFEIAYDPEDIHISLGLHIGLGF